MKKAYRLIAIVLLAAAVILFIRSRTQTAGSGDYPEYKSAEEIVSCADLVFSGTVADISYMDIDVGEVLPYTVYRIEVDTVYKGEISEETICIKQVRDDNGSKDNQSKENAGIRAGQAYLFLTQTYEHIYPSLLNTTQSWYLLDGSANPQNTSSKGGKIRLDDILNQFN